MAGISMVALAWLASTVFIVNIGWIKWNFRSPVSFCALCSVEE